jgi:hypothetical protein
LVTLLPALLLPARRFAQLWGFRLHCDQPTGESSMRGLVSSLFGVVIALSSVHAQCADDTDCKGERVCDAGACVAPTAAPLDDANGWGIRPPAADGADASASSADSSPGAAPATSPKAAGAAATAGPQPSPPADPNANLRERVMRPKSTALVVFGVVTLTASAFTFYGAYAMANLSLLCNMGHSSDCDDGAKTAIALGVGTVALIGVGIPMIVIGSKRVPAEEQPKVARRPWTRPRAALAPFVTPDSAGLRFQLSM